jgi:hypothetical protein
MDRRTIIEVVGKDVLGELPVAWGECFSVQACCNSQVVGYLGGTPTICCRGCEWARLLCMVISSFWLALEPVVGLKHLKGRRLQSSRHDWVVNGLSLSLRIVALGRCAFKLHI